MGFIETMTIAVALGTDAFSVAIVCGIQQFKSESIIKISSVIALFHIIMPLTGIYGGNYIQKLVFYFFPLESNIDRILTFVGSGLLLLIGFYMIIERWLERDDICNLNVTGWGLVALAFSVSIDSLSVGISLGMLGNVSHISVLIIGITAGVMMASGLYFGSIVGNIIGKEAQIVGGLALIGLGLRFSGLI